MSKSTVTDSIANNPASKVSEIRMMLSTDANKDKCMMLVEGVDDLKFYGYFVDDDRIEINVLDSCFYMYDILSLSKADNTLKNVVIGIKDADFDHITSKEYPIDNMFITDTHDWETMVISDACECKVALEGLERKEKDLFKMVMHHIEYLSYIKLYNQVEVLDKGLDGILFKGLVLSHFYDGENVLGLRECLDAIRAHGNNARLAHFPNEGDIQNIINRYSPVDYRQLTCGHDLIHGVVCRLTYIIGHNPKIGYDEIERLFRSSCDFSFFRKTSLYEQIDTWAKLHKTIVWAA